MKKAVFIDLDDTLIKTQALYENARAQLADYMGALGISGDDTIAFSKARSAELLPKFGYSKERFPQAFEDTLLHFRPAASAREVAQVRELGYAVFNSIAELKEGASEAITNLSKTLKIYLVTKGDREVQQKRIDDLPFKSEFAGIHIVEDKNEAMLRQIARKERLLPSEVVFVGDSLRSDIIPAVNAGMNAILVEGENWRQHEMDGHDLPKERAAHVPNLSEAIRMINRMIDADQHLRRSSATFRNRQVGSLMR